MIQNYAQRLLNREGKIAVWGGGYIGLSTAAYFARSGVESIVVDVIAEKAQAINRGEIDIVGLRDWLGFDLKPLVEKGLIFATLDWKEVLKPETLAHFVCIPTEKNGKPYLAYLEDVIRKIAQAPISEEGRPPLVVIESTLTPGTTDKLITPLLQANGRHIGRDILIGVAPRRDWFVDGTKSLKELDRVFGGQDQKAAETMRAVLSLICDRLHQASNHRTAEMVKSFENAYRHMEITLANQLSLAYPSDDIREALKLVGTKWNIGTFYPGFGTGGYCIPLSSQYVIAGAQRPEALGILSSTIETDGAINRLIAKSLALRGFREVGVLGLSYKANLQVAVLSPSVPFVEELLDHGVKVKLCDPFYKPEEIERQAKVASFDFPDGLKDFEAIVVVTDHDCFKKLSDRVVDSMGRCRFVLDNLGIWAHYKEKFLERGIEYHVCGDADWLGSLFSQGSRDREPIESGVS